MVKTHCLSDPEAAAMKIPLGDMKHLTNERSSS
jgi:hypothetical protein